VAQELTQLLSRQIGSYAGHPEDLIQVLHLVQEDLGYVPLETQQFVADALGVTLSRVYGVVTFYHYFRTRPVGKHTIRLCVGTACHVGGAARILRALQDRLGVKPGETTPDLEFTLETVACLGACALSPVMVADGTYHGHLTEAEAVAIVDKCVASGASLEGDDADENQ